MKIAVIIPFFNGEKYIEKCLDSVFKTGNHVINVIIVDNSSEHQTILERIIRKYRGVSYHRTKPRIGFSKAVNIGAELALASGSEIIIIINQDIVLLDFCIERLVSTLVSEKNIAAVGPIHYTNETFNIESFFIKSYLTQTPEIFKDALLNKLKSFYQLDYVSGACLAILSDNVRKYGLFDENYFMYYEDNDLCRKYNYLGLKVGINPYAGIIHYHQHDRVDDKVLKREEAWHRYKTSSRFIFELKDINRSLVSCIFNYIYYDLSNYFHDLFNLRMRDIIIHFYYDLKNIIKLRRVLVARQKEKLLCRKNNCKNGKL